MGCGSGRLGPCMGVLQLEDFGFRVQCSCPPASEGRQYGPEGKMIPKANFRRNDPQPAPENPMAHVG